MTFLLQEWNLLQQDIKVSYRKSQQSFSSFFSKDVVLIYCNDVEGLLKEFGCTTTLKNGNFSRLAEIEFKVGAAN